MAGKVIPLQRQSLTKLLEKLEEQGPTAKGVIAIWMDAEGKSHYHISGFPTWPDMFTALGLLDWVHADLVSDLVAVDA